MSEVDLTGEIEEDLYDRLKSVCLLHGITAEEFLTAFVQCAAERKDIYVPGDEVLNRAKLNQSSIKDQ